MAIKGGLKSTGNLDGGGDDEDWVRAGVGPFAAGRMVVMIAVRVVGAGAGASEGGQKKPLCGDRAGTMVVVVRVRTMNSWWWWCVG